MHDFSHCSRSVSVEARVAFVGKINLFARSWSTPPNANGRNIYLVGLARTLGCQAGNRKENPFHDASLALFEKHIFVASGRFRFDGAVRCFRNAK